MVGAARARPGPHSAALTGSGRSRARPEHGHSARPPPTGGSSHVSRPAQGPRIGVPQPAPISLSWQSVSVPTRIVLVAQVFDLSLTSCTFLRLITHGASVITLDKTQFVDGVALSKRHLFIPAGMITKGRNVQRAHPVVWARETTSPLLPIRHRPTVSSRGRPRPPPTSPPRPVPDGAGRGDQTREGHPRPPPSPPPGGGHGRATTSGAAGPAGPARAAGGGSPPRGVVTAKRRRRTRRAQPGPRAPQAAEVAERSGDWREIGRSDPGPQVRDAERRGAGRAPGRTPAAAPRARGAERRRVGRRAGPRRPD